MHAVFPTDWKRSLVVPVRKKRNPASLSDYRPIPLLCTLSKVLEKLVFGYIRTHLNLNNLLDPQQAGFREGNSTQTALLRIMEDVRSACDRRMVTLPVLFDFSRAFDMVDHSLLIRKLSKFKLADSVLLWFQSYLSDRYQAVTGPGGERSSWLPVASGVPQGSVLGPLLFSLFVNDLPEILTNSRHMFYADDLQIYLHCHPSDIQEGISKITSDVAAVQAWAEKNNLKLNLSKTKAICLGSRQYVCRLDLANGGGIRLPNHLIPFESSVRSLGVTLTSNLTWHEHVNIVCSRVSRSLDQLKLHRRLFTLQLRRRLVAALILPHFDYCSAIYSDITAELNTRLQRSFNSCIRFIYNIRWHEHVSPMRLMSGFLSVENRRLYNMARLFYIVLQTQTPAYLSDLISFPEISAREARSTINIAKRISIPTCRTELYKRSYMVRMAYFWNSLPDTIAENPTLYSFKNALFTFLTERERSEIVRPV